MRFARQIPVFGEDGQKRIEGSHVAVVGLGGLGCNVITQLASAGLGRMTIVDCQIPDETNLNRQFVYSYLGLGERKTVSSKKWIETLSGNGTRVDAIDARIDLDNVSVLRGCDIIVDCTDNVATRLVLNRFSLDSGTPLVHGGTESMIGQVTVVIPGMTPCLGCIMRDRGRKDLPAVGAVVSMVAAAESIEVLKLITGKGETLAGKLLTIDAWNNSYRTIDIVPDDGCSECGKSG